MPGLFQIPVRPADGASSSKSASDISHLVRKKVSIYPLKFNLTFAVDLRFGGGSSMYIKTGVNDGSLPIKGHLHCHLPFS